MLGYVWLLVRWLLCTLAVAAVCAALDTGFLISLSAGAAIGAWHGIAFADRLDRRES